MGKGDKRTARGKRVMGSSGVSRQKKKVKYVAPEVPVKKAEAPKAEKKAAPKKAAAKKPAAKKAAPSASAKATGDSKKKAAAKKD